MSACEIPIHDLLKSVPEDARMWYEHNATHHQHIPVGVLCKKAVEEIDRLKLELKRKGEE